MAATRGRDFTADELIGRQIRIEGPHPSKRKPTPTGYDLMVIADDEEVNNVLKITLTLEPNSVIEAMLTLYRNDLTVCDKIATEEVTLRDNIELSFSAIVSEVS